MGLAIDWNNNIIGVTSPDTDVDGQTLHDFIEDQMASPIGMNFGDILQPEGKIEDPTNPGVYSQIIMVLHSPWQIQFWGGSGYSRIYGAKIVGGLSDQPLKATGTAGDITVLESPVDGVTVGVSGGAGVTEQDFHDYMDSYPGKDGFKAVLPGDIAEQPTSVSIKKDTDQIEDISQDVVDALLEEERLRLLAEEERKRKEFLRDIAKRK